MNLLDSLDERGWRAKAISIDHLTDIEEDIESLHRSGLVDEGFYRENLANFKYEIPREIPDAKSIIVVSVPQPAFTIIFKHAGKSISAVIPPTYGRGAETNKMVQDFLGEIAEQGRFARAMLPLKTLAARSGLAEYGRMNVTFVPGFGSYHRLVAFFTDVAGLSDSWQDRRMMSRCSNCKACIKGCPTGSITTDKFLIRAERCLACLNETDSSQRFPSWVEDKMHNAIVGCMRCQRACPENKGLLKWEKDRAVFSEEETNYLMNGIFSGEEAKVIEEKLRAVGLDLTVFPRNLSVLMRKES